MSEELKKYLDRDGRLTSELRDLIEGMSVSIDVSTGDHDSGNRLFGVVNEVMDDSHDKCGVTLLVYDAKPNFAPVAARELGVEAERREFEREALRHDVLDDEGLSRNDSGEYVDDVAQASWKSWLLCAARSAAQGTAPAPVTDPVKKIITGVREFYLGMLSRHLSPEVFDQARAEDATRVAYDGVAELFVALLESDAAQGAKPESAQVSTEQAGDAWISVEDRPPDESLLRFLVTGRAVSGGPLGVHMATLYEGDMYFEGAAESGGCNPCINDVVTHWMPLPAAPSPNNSPAGADKEP